MTMKRILLLGSVAAVTTFSGDLRVLGGDPPAAPAQKEQENPNLRRGPWERNREEWQKLTPEERQKRLKEWREAWQNMTPEQRAAKRQEIRERLAKQIADLNKKKAEGTITEAETKRLASLESLRKRWQEQEPREPGAPAAPDKPAGKPATAPGAKK